MKKGLPQLYGSQSKIDNTTGMQRLYKIQDKLNINKPRESVDLPPLTREHIDTSE